MPIPLPASSDHLYSIATVISTGWTIWAHPRDITNDHSPFFKCFSTVELMQFSHNSKRLPVTTVNGCIINRFVMNRQAINHFYASKAQYCECNNEFIANCHFRWPNIIHSRRVYVPNAHDVSEYTFKKNMGQSDLFVWIFMVVAAIWNSRCQFATMCLLYAEIYRTEVFFFSSTALHHMRHEAWPYRF